MEPAPPSTIDTEEKLSLALQYWKDHTFSKKYLKLEDVVETLNTPQRLVEARQEFAPRWVLSRPGSKRPATLWTVAVWRWNSDLETGNFVPPGATAPARLAEGRIQTVPNSLCQFSYAVDTTHDRSLWEAQEVFEAYIKTFPKFNPAKKDRRKWQSGMDPNRSLFVFNSQIFVKRSPYTRSKEASVSYCLHEWIKNTTMKGMEYFPNHEKPEMFEPDDANGLRPLSECTPSTLKTGDLVWLSFSIEFFIGSKFWSTNLIPYEFVRVGTVAFELLSDIKDFALEEEEGPRERLGTGMRSVLIPSQRELQVEPTSADDGRNEFFLQPGDDEKYRHLRYVQLQSPPPTVASESETDLHTESTTYNDAYEDEDDDDDDDVTEHEDEEIVADVDMGDQDASINSSAIVVDEAITNVPTSVKLGPQSGGKKRAASVERPPVDPVVGGNVVGGRVLRDRPKRVKTVAR